MPNLKNLQPRQSSQTNLPAIQPKNRKSTKIAKKRGNGKNKPLTFKQQSFIDQYLIYSGNGVQAYLHSEYSNRNYEQANIEAAKLLKKSYIREEIKQRRQKELKNLDVSLERILKEITLIAFADISSFIDPKDGTVPNPATLPENVRKAISGLQVITSYGKGGQKLIKHKITRDDKSKALDMLMRYSGAYEVDNKQKQIDMGAVLTALLDMVKALPEADAIRIMGQVEDSVGLLPEKAGVG